jgi:hypothetical protein
MDFKKGGEKGDFRENFTVKKVKKWGPEAPKY